MVHKQTTAFSWDFEEYAHEDKHIRWFVALGLVVVAGAALAFFLDSALLGAVILIGGGLLAFLAKQPPKRLSVSISERGIQYDEVIYSYERLLAFWITDDEDGDPELLVLSDRNIFPLFSIPLPEGIDLLDLRQYLGQFIDEQELREPWINKLVDHLGI